MKIEIVIQADVNPDVMLQFKSFRENPERTGVEGIREILQGKPVENFFLYAPSIRKDWVTPTSIEVREVSGAPDIDAIDKALQAKHKMDSTRHGCCGHGPYKD